MIENKRLNKWTFDDSNHNPSDKFNYNLIGRGGIRDIAFELSTSLDILNTVLVKNISWIGDYWEISSEKDNVFNSHSLLLTMPIPQIIDLLTNSKIEIPNDIRKDLKEVEYERNIVGMFILESESQLKNKGGMEFLNGDISFITDNNLKGINKHKTAVTVEMSDEFSRGNWSLTEEELFFKIKEIAAEYLGSEIIDYKIHRWKFSRPSRSYRKKFEFFHSPSPIFLAGDAFGGSSVESAYISGQQAAISIIKDLEIRKIMDIK
jgi:hypothetical protein